MSCNSCASSFTLFRKEKGCPGCGFSYCSNCLNNKVFLPKQNCEKKVCAKCSIESNSMKKSNFEPPAAYLKLLAANQVNAKDTENIIQEKLNKLKEDKNTDSKVTDDEISKRLKNIKGEVPSTSDSEIRERLAKLRGVPTQIIPTQPSLPLPDHRTEQEQADDLLKQYVAQTSIDNKYSDDFNNVVEDIENRLQKLKGNPENVLQINTQPSKKLSDSEDEEEAVKKIIEKMKKDAELDNELEPGTTGEELPFCEICNEDATLRCLGCKYLFCRTCFSEHKDDDDGCNKYEPYTAPNNH